MSKTDSSGQPLSRDRIIVRTSIIGILTNVALAAFKAVIGLIASSIAMVLDAVNNLSDALSSVVTIIGSKISRKRPDKKHPLGHGRVEYLSALIVGAIVFFAGVTSLIESVKGIINPQAPDHSWPSLVIISVAIVVKLILGRFVKSQGRKAGSGALEASGSDALFDALLSASVLVSTIIFMITGFSLEAYVGIVISLFIIKASIDIILETLDDILGKRADAELTKKIKEILVREPEVRGAFDLFVNNYGPGKNYASVHLELPDTMTVEELDILTRRVQASVYSETGVILTGVGVYSYNTSNDEAAEIRNRVMEKVLSHEWAIQLHGFYLDQVNRIMRFDVVLSFDITDKEALETLTSEVKEMYPGYSIFIAPDVDLSD
jgi:cation diffusion facilitator family transporter